NMGGNGVKLMIFELKGVYVMTHEYRVEQDLIGMKNVPEHAYYGIQTVRAEENFNITGYMISHEIITALAIVKKVTTITNMELGHLDQTIENLFERLQMKSFEGNGTMNLLSIPFKVGQVLQSI